MAETWTVKSSADIPTKMKTIVTLELSCMCLGTSDFLLEWGCRGLDAGGWDGGDRSWSLIAWDSFLTKQSLNVFFCISLTMPNFMTRLQNRGISYKRALDGIVACSIANVFILKRKGPLLWKTLDLVTPLEDSELHKKTMGWI